MLDGGKAMIEGKEMRFATIFEKQLYTLQVEWQSGSARVVMVQREQQ